jgi:hypothetical protein
VIYFSPHGQDDARTPKNGAPGFQNGLKMETRSASFLISWSASVSETQRHRAVRNRTRTVREVSRAEKPCSLLITGLQVWSSRNSQLVKMLSIRDFMESVMCYQGKSRYRDSTTIAHLHYIVSLFIAVP